MKAWEPKKRLSAAERRGRILQAAEMVFAANGYDKASVEQIATAADVTKPVLYDHFTSKLDLFVRLSESIRDEMIERGQQALARAKNPEERIRAGFEAFFAFVEERPGAARVMFIMPREQKALERPIAAVQRGATDSLSLLLRTIVSVENETQAQAITEFLKHGLHALAEWWADHPNVPRHFIVETVMAIAWGGLSTYSAADPASPGPSDRQEATARTSRRRKGEGS